MRSRSAGRTGLPALSFVSARNPCEPAAERIAASRFGSQQRRGKAFERGRASLAWTHAVGSAEHSIKCTNVLKAQAIGDRPNSPVRRLRCSDFLVSAIESAVSDITGNPPERSEVHRLRSAGKTEAFCDHFGIQVRRGQVAIDEATNGDEQRKRNRTSVCGGSL